MSLIKRIAGMLPARRTLHIHLAPQSLLAVVRHGGRNDEEGALQVDFSNPTGQWQAPLAALRALLTGTEAVERGAGAAARAALAARLPLHVSLSGRWCQALMAPWSDALLSEPAASRFLNMQLAAIYGDAARAWTASSDDAPYGQPRLVCGIATELLDALHALAADHGTRCAAIEPLASAVSTWIAPAKPDAFAIIEPGHITMAALANGRVSAIQSQPCSAAWHGELAQAWQRWTLRSPELVSIEVVSVVDMGGQASGPAEGQLPARFRLADSPFSHAVAAGPHAPSPETAPRNGKLPLSIVPPETSGGNGSSGNAGKVGHPREAA